jgi:hypothetical protein
MTNDWIIDVLMDLKKFSANNKLDHLAENLDNTIMIAMSELSMPEPSIHPVVGEIDSSRTIARTAFSREVVG